MADDLIRDGRLLRPKGHLTVMHDDRSRQYSMAVSPAQP